MSTALAWAAGIIDGEGCIYLKRTPAEQRDDLINDSFALGLRVVMGHEPAIARLKQLFSVGNYYLLKQRGYSDAWAYMASARKAETALRMVRPYLVVKAEEADLAFEFLALPLHRPGGRGGCRTPMPPELLAKKIEPWERMRDLKPSSRFRKDRMR